MFKERVLKLQSNFHLSSTVVLAQINRSILDRLKLHLELLWYGLEELLPQYCLRELISQP